MSFYTEKTKVMSFYTEKMKRFSDEITKKFTPEYVKERAAEGNKLLSEIPRWEKVCSLTSSLDKKNAIKHRGEPVDLQRVSCWTRVEITGEALLADDLPSLIRQVDAGVVSAGADLERLLAEGDPQRGFYSVKHWEVPVRLYSLLGAPHILDLDGLVFAHYGRDTVEVRIVSYCNVGPDSPEFAE